MSESPNPANPPEAAAVTAAYRAGTGTRVLIVVGILTIALVGAFVWGLRSRNRAELALATEPERLSSTPPTVEVATATRADSEAAVLLPGEARPFSETTLYARTSGYLKSWLVDIGDPVEEGQLLATIDTPELDDQIKTSEARLAELQTEVRLMQTAADFAKISFDRWDTPDGVVSQQERDQKKAELDASLARLASSRAKVDLGATELQALKTLQGFKHVVAPFKGVVTERRLDVGDLVTAGSSSSTTPLFKIVQYDQVRVFVDVPQTVSAQIHVGMKARAYAPEHAERQFEGSIDRTTGVMDPKARTLRIEVLVPNPDHELLPGTYLQVALLVNRTRPPVRVPAAAVTMRSGGPEAAVIASDGTLSFHKVSIQQDLGDVIELNSGVAEGDTVALNIGQDALEGDHVTAHKILEAPAIKRVVLQAPAADHPAMAPVRRSVP